MLFVCLLLARCQSQADVLHNRGGKVCVYKLKKNQMKLLNPLEEEGEMGLPQHKQISSHQSWSTLFLMETLVLG